MAVNTILLDFSVAPEQAHESTQQVDVASKVETVLRDYLTGMNPINSVSVAGGLLKLYTSEGGTVTTLRIFNNGLITLNIEYYKGEKQEPLFTYEQSKELESRLGTAVNAFRAKRFPPIRRGMPIDTYLTSSDERLLEYDIDEIVFEERTPYQKIQIVHSKSLGNTLVLDDLQNLSEADLIYTESLMCRGKENYKDKEILILGGGDGALLYEMLKEEPRNVLMIEIDDVVMKACAKHMRSVCGDVLDKRSGPNYEIIVGDCMNFMDECIKESRKFDYVFGDLTDIPISQTPTGEVWDFFLTILEKSFKILKEDGKFMTHGNGSNNEEALKMYEEQLMKLKPPVQINKTSAFVPSFLEDWVFYQISFA